MIADEDADGLKSENIDEGQIREVNQIICYFNYGNRSLDGPDVSSENDLVGYYSD